jgi:drug/metabolite transporter (DMT)-like permease
VSTALEAFHPGVVAFSRLALGAAVLAMVPGARSQIVPSDRPRLLLLGAVWMGVPFLLLAFAQLRVGSAVAGMANGTLPIFAAVIAWLWVRRRPRAAHLAGLVLGVVGVVLISWPSELQGFENDATGMALLFVAFGLLGVAANLAVPLQQRYGSLPVVLKAQYAGLAVLAPFAAAGLPRSSWSWTSGLALLPLGVLSSGLAFVALATLLGTTGADRGTIATYLVPVVAILLGVAFRGEAIAGLAGIGTALVLAGSWLASRGHVAPPELPFAAVGNQPGHKGRLT